MRKTVALLTRWTLLSGLLFAGWAPAASAAIIPLDSTDIAVATSAGEDKNPDLAMHANGNGFVVVYEAPDANGSGIFFKRYNANWQLLSGPIAVNTFSSNGQTAPSIAMDSSGNFVVVWESRGQDAGDSSSQSGVYGRRFLADGTAIDAAEFRVNTTTAGNQAEPDVAMNPSGQFVVVFQNAGDICAQSYSGVTVGGSGSPTTGSAEVVMNDTSASSDVQSKPAVALNTAGSYLVVYNSANQDHTGDVGVYARRGTFNGALPASEFLVNVGVTNGNQQSPDIAIDNNSNYTVVWASDNVDGSGSAVMLQRYGPFGAAQGGAVQVNTGITTNNQWNPHLSVNWLGNALVSWTGEESDVDGLGSDVYCKVFNSGGGVVITDRLISSSTLNDKDEDDAIAALNGQGDFVVTFSSNASGTSDVFLRRFAEDPDVSFDAETSHGVETENAAISLVRYGAPYALANTETTVQISRVDGSAQPGTDFSTSFPTNVVFPANGSTQQTLAIGIVDNLFPNPSKTIELSISSYTNGSSGGLTSHIYTIDDDDPTPSVSVEDVTIAEGDSGATQVSFTVWLSEAGRVPITVDYATVDGTALAGSDYTAVSGTLTFQAGETSKAVTVLASGDTIFEEDQTFTLDLSNPVYAVITDGQGVGTITNDDAAPSFTINDRFLSESAGTVTFTVTRTGATEISASVNYATVDGTAVSVAGGAGSPDYDAVSGTLTFGPSLAATVTQTLTVSLSNDAVYEAVEQFAVNLSDAVGAAIADGQGVGTIADDDAAPTISINDVSASEAGGFTFTVTLSGATALPISVNYATADGTAVSVGNGIGTPDYTATSGTLFFSGSASGTQTLTMTVPITDDDVREYTEQFALNLSNPTNGATIADGQGVGTISDDDTAPSISIAGGEVAEGDSGATTISFAVTLSSASAQTVTVNYATQEGTATTAGSDYSSVTGPLTFAPGETSKTVEVTVFGDTVVEASETFTVTLSGATNATVTTGSATGTITNDDAPSVTRNTSVIAQDATSLTINGSKFSTNPAENTVAFNFGAAGTVTASTAESLTVTFTTNPTRGGVLTAVVTTLGTSTGGSEQVAVVDALPVALDDVAYVKKTSSVDIDVLENDSDSGEDALTVTAVSTPTNGTAEIIENGGKVRYTSTGKKALPDSFTYTLEDIYGNEATATVTIGEQITAQAGIYNGLIQPADGTTPSNDRVGLVKITLSKSASTFTASLKLAGQSISASGAILPDGQVTFGSKKTADFVVKRKNKPDLKLTLKISMDELVDTLEGELTENDLPFAKIAAERALYTAAKNPAAPYEAVPPELLGTYTVRLAALTAPNQSYDADQYPAGDGIGVMTVATSGVVKLTGTLADGTTFSYSNSLSRSRDWPFYLSTAKGLGSLSGYVRFEEDTVTTVSDLSGLDIQWYHPANDKAVRYKGGWASGIATHLLGSKFVLPTTKSGLPVLTLDAPKDGGNAGLVLADAEFGSTGLERGFNVTGKATGLPALTSDSEKVTLSVPRTGYFTGKFKFPSSTKAGTYKGIIYQKDNRGYGFFLGGSESGSVYLYRIE